MGVTLAVLASGRGSNYAAIQTAIEEGRLDARTGVVISDKKDAPVLDLARDHGVRAEYIPYDKTSRQVFEERAVEVIREVEADLVLLAGFMRLITPYMIEAFEGRMLNIHPSLLPAFRGLNAQKQALDCGVKIAGCTVHLVTQDMDAGPILGQRAVLVDDDDTEETLSNRILEQEHQLYPAVIAEMVAKNVREKHTI